MIIQKRIIKVKLKFVKNTKKEVINVFFEKESLALKKRYHTNFHNGNFVFYKYIKTNRYSIQFLIKSKESSEIFYFTKVLFDKNNIIENNFLLLKKATFLSDFVKMYFIIFITFFSYDNNKENIYIWKDKPFIKPFMEILRKDKYNKSKLINTLGLHTLNIMYRIFYRKFIIKLRKRVYIRTGWHNL